MSQVEMPRVPRGLDYGQLHDAYEKLLLANHHTMRQNVSLERSLLLEIQNKENYEKAWKEEKRLRLMLEKK